MPQKVLITGATGGIGKALCFAFARKGNELFLTGTSDDKLNTLKLEILLQFPEAKVHYYALNLLDKIKAAECISIANSTMNGLDVLICNAGITKDCLAIRMKDEDFENVINVNLTSTFILNREAIKIMMKNRYGRVINIASVVGQTGNLGQANYAASKAGMIAMSKSMALEVATRGITINCIAPGFISSQMTDAMTEESKEKSLNMIPMRAYGEGSDVANAAIFLANKKSKYITGETISVNGGIFMK